VKYEFEIRTKIKENLDLERQHYMIKK